jgi:TPR repeat protein
METWRSLRLPGLILLQGVLLNCADRPLPARANPGGPAQSAPTAKPIADACRPDDPTGCAKQCDDGDGESCNVLGKLYRRGERVEKDLGRAFELFKRSCAGGSTKGCVNLGNAYRSGEGVAKDDVRATGLFREACEAHDDFGCTRLGDQYRDGRGVQQSYGQAIALFTQACGRAHGSACLNLGVLHARGDGVLRSPSEAASFYEKACRGGEPIGCRYLGLAYEQGDGVTKDASHSAALYQQSCNAHDANGCAYLGTAYRDGRGVPQDKQKGAQMFVSACDAGSAEGCTFLGVAYFRGDGVPPDPARATSAFEAGCKLGQMSACGFAADGQKDPGRTIALLAEACDGGEVLSCERLGLRYLTGDGVTVDRKRAAELLKRKCDTKDDDASAACEIVADLEDTRSRSTPMTSQVAGFRFGMTAQEFSAACTGSGHHITESTPAGMLCDGVAAGVGFGVNVTDAKFCDGRVCEFILIREPHGESAIDTERLYDDIKARLSSRYGDASTRARDKGVKRTAWGWSGSDGAFQSELILVLAPGTAFELALIYRSQAAIVRDAQMKHHEDTNL